MTIEEQENIGQHDNQRIGKSKNRKILVSMTIKEQENIGYHDNRRI